MVVVAALVLHGDALEVLRTIPDASVDACVTDPPAGIAFMGKDWDRDKGGRDAWIAWLAEIMGEVLRVLKPGGHALVWALPRTSHWTATAVEDAGFEIRDVGVHLFGTGFPKSLNVSKAIDTVREDDVRPVCRFLRSALDAKGWSAKHVADHFGFHSRMVDHWAARDTDSQPCCPTIEQWEQLKLLLGFSDEMDAEVIRFNARKGEPSDTYKSAAIVGEHEGAAPGFVGERFSVRDTTIRERTPEAAQWDGFGTALKPAAEHWILARRTLDGTVAANVLAHGCGALNVDECRIGDVDTRSPTGNRDSTGWGTKAGAIAGSPLGRWPANVTLDEEAAAELDAQSGNRPGMSGGGKHKGPGGMFGAIDGNDSHIRADTGGASRFFYVAKPSTREREEGLDHLPRRSAGELVDREEGSAGMSNPRAGAGRTSKGRANHHPTVKSIALMRWLVRLITPPGGLVLDPFCGSGSTGCAAVLEGMSFVGIEQDPDYVAIATARIAHWEAKP